MNLFDDERKIIDVFQSIQDEEVRFPSLNDDVEDVYRNVHEENYWKHWTYSAGKSDPPPDFFNEKSCLMMDVMRIDDHAFLSKKGKVINPTNAGESQLRKELENSGILEMFPNYKNIFVNAKTTLPTKEDHNYTFYIDNFRRVVSEHSKKVDLYKKNHPGFKTIFFVMDESSAYFSSGGKGVKPEEGKMYKGKPHLFFFDKTFIDSIRQAPIDYLIWYAPFKLLRTDQGLFNLPKAVIYDIGRLDFEEIIYDVPFMVSAEI